MTDRHVPRLCRGCHAPMAGQEASCWRCGAQWASEKAPPTKLRAIAGGRLTHPATEIRDHDDRWTNEGAGVGSEEPAPPLHVVAATR